MVVFCVIFYAYLRAKRDAEVKERRTVLDVLAKQIDEKSPNYLQAVRDYNLYVSANAGVLFKYGIDAKPIVPTGNIVPDVRSGKFIDLTTGQIVAVTGERLATQRGPNTSLN
jgi:hypothetical protein